MTNKEAIAILQKEYLCVNRNCNIERSCAKCDLVMPNKEPILQAYKIAIEALEKQEPKWIPVSESLPKRSGEYFVSVIDGSGEDDDYEAVGVAWFAHKKDYDIKESEWRELEIGETVIAWMPLPKSYKTESEEKA